mgnify:FL=1
MKVETAKKIYDGLGYVESGSDVRAVVKRALEEEAGKPVTLSTEATRLAINTATEMVKQHAREDGNRLTRILINGLRMN